MRRASIACALLLMAAGDARAQEPGSKNEQELTENDPHLRPAARPFESPERFILELRGGPYSPSVARQRKYGTFFNDDSGPNINFHLDGVVWRQPNVFYLTVGGSLGFISFSGRALPVTGDQSVTEETTLRLIPVIATVGVRVDVLPRKLRIPLIFGARVGWEWANWDTGTGAIDNASGWSLGPVVSAQLALDLDSIEPGGARNLDEEWGINHTYLFAEVFHFATLSKSLPVGDTNWLLGLGLVF
jgi:hypothetical protein